MNAATISTGLYLPFTLLLAIFAIVYLVAGYRRGTGRSLLSLAASVVAILVSLAATKGLAILLAGPVTAALPANLVDQIPAIAQGFIQGGVEILLSYCLFWVLFVVALAVLKAIAKRPVVEEKVQKLSQDAGWSRGVGACIRGVDALLVVLMLLLPLYGGIATTAPAATALVRVSAMMDDSDDQGETLEMLQTMADHPVVTLYRYGPAAWVNNCLTSFTINGKTTNIAAAADSITGLLERTGTLKEALDNKDKQAALDASQDLVGYARDNVVNERWFYNLVMSTVDNLQEKAEEKVDDADRYAEISSLLDMSQEDFQTNANIVLDFTSSFLDIYSTYGDLSAVDNAEVQKELLTLYGDLQTQSPQAQEVTRVVLEDVLDLLPENTLDIGSGILSGDVSIPDGVDLDDVDLDTITDIVNSNQP